MRRAGQRRGTRRTARRGRSSLPSGSDAASASNSGGAACVPRRVSTGVRARERCQQPTRLDQGVQALQLGAARRHCTVCERSAAAARALHERVQRRPRRRVRRCRGGGERRGVLAGLRRIRDLLRRGRDAGRAHAIPQLLHLLRAHRAAAMLLHAHGLGTAAFRVNAMGRAFFCQVSKTAQTRRPSRRAASRMQRCAPAALRRRRSIRSCSS